MSRGQAMGPNCDTATYELGVSDKLHGFLVPLISL